MSQRRSVEIRPTPVFRALRPGLVLAFSLIFTAVLAAQKGGTGTGSGRIPPSNIPPPVKPQSVDFDQKHVELQSQGPKSQTSGERDTCFLPPLGAIEFPTVAVSSLQISAKAKKEYGTACAALKAGKYDEAGEGLRKALKYEPKYLGALVTLGQLQAARQKLDDARGTCTSAQAVDAKYLPAYLCLADVAVRSEHWDEALGFTQRALELDPANDPVAYDYNAAALLNLHRLPEAEKSAFKAIEIDHNHSDPRVHFLLAQIYEAEGEQSKEAAELEEFLKYASPEEAATVKQYLSALKK